MNRDDCWMRIKQPPSNHFDYAVFFGGSFSPLFRPRIHPAGRHVGSHIDASSFLFSSQHLPTRPSNPGLSRPVQSSSMLCKPLHATLSSQLFIQAAPSRTEPILSQPIPVRTTPRFPLNFLPKPCPNIPMLSSPVQDFAVQTMPRFPLNIF